MHRKPSSIPLYLSCSRKGKYTSLCNRSRGTAPRRYGGLVGVRSHRATWDWMPGIVLVLHFLHRSSLRCLLAYPLYKSLEAQNIAELVGF